MLLQIWNDRALSQVKVARKDAYVMYPIPWHKIVDSETPNCIMDKKNMAMAKAEIECRMHFP